MSIQEHLNKIRNAIYGHEVRESIAKGIETAYDDASEYGNANMEVKIARGTHPTLRDRLNEVDNKQQQSATRLDQKADKTHIWNMPNMGQDIKEAFTGGSVAVVGENGVIGHNNIVDGTVSMQSLDFLETTSNLFREDETKRNKYLDAREAGFVGYDALTGSRVSKKIYLGEAQSIYIQNSRRITYWDVNEEYLGRYAATSAGTGRTILRSEMPTDTSYIIFDYMINDLTYETNQVNLNGRKEYEHPFYIPKKLTDFEEAAERFASLPPKIYTIKNKPSRIYFDNIVDDINDLKVDVNGVGKQMDDYWEFTPVSTITDELTIDIYKDFKKIKSLQTEIIVSDITQQPNKQLLVIGDSTVNNGRMTERLLELYGEDSSSLTLRGTRGSGLNLHEGRSGWNISAYRKPDVYEGVVNPFYNNGDFDFAHYMSYNGVSSLSDVVIQFGINDIFGYYDDQTVQDVIDVRFSDMSYIINNIHSHNPNIKIGIVVTIPPNASQDAFGESYGVGQTKWRYKRNNAMWNSRLIERFGTREHEKVFLIPQNAAIDTTAQIRDGVHPTDVVGGGYDVLGEVLYAYLKNN